jgi:hypothetical protein
MCEAGLKVECGRYGLISQREYCMTVAVKGSWDDEERLGQASGDEPRSPDMTDL